MKAVKRVMICVAILVVVFLAAAFVAGIIAEIMNNAKYAYGDKDRKYESIGDAATAFLAGTISALTVGVAIVIWRVRKWRKQDNAQ